MRKLIGIFMTLIWLFNYSLIMPLLFEDEEVIINEGNSGISIVFETSERPELIKLNATPDFIKEAFPEDYLNLTKMHYYNNSCIPRGFVCVAGYYDSTEIYLAIRSGDEDWLKTAIVHEMGHLLSDEYMNDSLGNEWMQLYYKNISITLYGHKGFNEDFAEYYTIMVGFEYDNDSHREIPKNRIKGKDDIIEILLREFPVFDLR